MQSYADGTLSEDELHFLARRADGGFGLVEPCATHVAQDGKAWLGKLGVHEDAMLPGLTARIHQGGALLSAQLFHGGLRADTACRAGTEAAFVLLKRTRELCWMGVGYVLLFQMRIQKTGITMAH